MANTFLLSSLSPKYTFAFAPTSGVQYMTLPVTGSHSSLYIFFSKPLSMENFTNTSSAFTSTYTIIEPDPPVSLRLLLYNLQQASDFYHPYQILLYVVYLLLLYNYIHIKKHSYHYKIIVVCMHFQNP